MASISEQRAFVQVSDPRPVCLSGLSHRQPRSLSDLRTGGCTTGPVGDVSGSGPPHRDYGGAFDHLDRHGRLRMDSTGRMSPPALRTRLAPRASPPDLVLGEDASGKKEDRREGSSENNVCRRKCQIEIKIDVQVKELSQKGTPSSWDCGSRYRQRIGRDDVTGRRELASDSCRLVVSVDGDNAGGAADTERPADVEESHAHARTCLTLIAESTRSTPVPLVPARQFGLRADTSPPTVRAVRGVGAGRTRKFDIAAASCVTPVRAVEASRGLDVLINNTSSVPSDEDSSARPNPCQWHQCALPVAVWSAVTLAAPASAFNLIERCVPPVRFGAMQRAISRTIDVIEFSFARSWRLHLAESRACRLQTCSRQGRNSRSRQRSRTEMSAGSRASARPSSHRITTLGTPNARAGVGRLRLKLSCLPA